MKPIPAFDGYFATQDGKIFSRRSGEAHEMAPHFDRSGYLNVSLRLDGRKNPKRFHVHHLVACTFLRPPAPGEQMRHLDGIRTHNDASNLAWGTVGENAADRVLHGTAPVGRKNPNVRFPEATIRQVKGLRRQGLSQDAISAACGVSQTHVSRIVRGLAWPEVNP